MNKIIYNFIAYTFLTMIVSSNAEVIVTGAFNAKLTDPESGVVYVLSLDKRRVIAKSSTGQLLWDVNPYQDAKLSFYRIANPPITYFSFPTEQIWQSHKTLGSKKDFIHIQFKSSQGGFLQKQNGKFVFWGQD
ncbi:MAG: hypothetical protein LBK76_11995 [Verrucomicrobiales bacterium]|jgi:hypothetical protein|nr:hypothetical protein [Verrucomicrobiales bacterium]